MWASDEYKMEYHYHHKVVSQTPRSSLAHVNNIRFSKKFSKDDYSSFDEVNAASAISTRAWMIRCHPFARKSHPAQKMVRMRLWNPHLTYLTLCPTHAEEQSVIFAKANCFVRQRLLVYVCKLCDVVFIRFYIKNFHLKWFGFFQNAFERAWNRKHLQHLFIAANNMLCQ